MDVQASVNTLKKQYLSAQSSHEKRKKKSKSTSQILQPFIQVQLSESEHFINPWGNNVVNYSN